MQFEGLKGLLKKSKKAAMTATPATAEPTTAAPLEVSPSSTLHSTTSKSAGSASDPYAAALSKAHHHQQQQQQQRAYETVPSHGESRKRSREPSADADHTASADQSSTADRPADAAAAGTPGGSGSAKVLKTAEEVVAQQQQACAVLLSCRAKLEQYWRASAEVSALAGYPATCPVPEAVGSYLLQWFVEENRVSPATGEPEMALLDREFALLAAMSAADDTGDNTGSENACGASSDHAETLPASAVAAQHQIGATVRVLWYLIALRWQYSINPSGRALSAQSKPQTTVSSTSQGLPLEQQGWSPYVYLALHGALGADIRLTLGRVVAQEVDQWRSLTRTRQFALELLAYLYSDYRSLQAAPTAACIVPADLRDALHAMLVRHLQHERNFLAVRQDYVDVTMGTANWKLGLFSGGEVHMRRSMERVERNRIHHLLNNEHATHLLQSVRELTTFAETHKASLTDKFFLLSAGV